MQLSPYHAGLAGRRRKRLQTAPALTACCCPVGLSTASQPLTQRSCLPNLSCLRQESHRLVIRRTFRSHLAPLVRRGRALAHTRATLEAGMWLVSTSYNLCWTHDSLRLQAPAGSGRTWCERTPAMAAGLTDHLWTLRDLLHYRVPLPAWAAPKRRGRPLKQVQPPTILRAA